MARVQVAHDPRHDRPLAPKVLLAQSGLTLGTPAYTVLAKRLTDLDPMREQSDFGRLMDRMRY
jgi:hypothetical protein